MHHRWHHWLTSPSTNQSLAWRYGMLAVLAYLMVWQIYLEKIRPSESVFEMVQRFAILIMLVLNHLAYSFAWSPTVTAGLRILAIVWLFVGMMIVFPLR